MIFNERRNALSDLLRELSLLEPDQIAQHFKSLRITGIARNCGRCPVALYLNNKLEGRHFAALNQVFMLDNIDVDDEFDLSNSVETPPSVKSFMKKFDAGKYLFLDAGRPIE